MPARENPADRGRERGRRAAELIRREIRDGRVDRGLSQSDVGRALRMSASEISRLERGIVPLDFETASALLAIVGLDLSARAYPGGQPFRDRPQGDLLGRLRGRLHASLVMGGEVGLPIPGDLRAWDATISGRSIARRWSIPVEAETGPRDCQALERRLELKMRDAGAATMILLLADTRLNREFVRANRETLAARFPLPGPRALELLAVGESLPASALILL